MRIRNGMVFTEGEFVERDVCVDGDRFVAACPDATCELDASGCFVIPGLVDLHFHGCAGYDFCDGTDEALAQIARWQARQGVTAICPATMTFPESMLGPAMDAGARFAPASDMAALVGINMEGPFISPDKVGAQNPAYVQEPNVGLFERLQLRSGGLVKLLDIAPELPGAIEFIERLSPAVRISVAHTCADYDRAAEAFRAGARQVTHLYNAMPPLSHRAPGVVGAAFDNPHVMVELIADGVHVHPSAVRAAFALFGESRVILISDTMEAAGLADGAYQLGGQHVNVSGSRATLADGTIAGGVTCLSACLRMAVHGMGVPLGSAVRAATENPARALGIFSERGSIEVGKVADCVLLDADLSVRHVVVRGNLIDG